MNELIYCFGFAYVIFLMERLYNSFFNKKDFKDANITMSPDKDIFDLSKEVWEINAKMAKKDSKATRFLMAIIPATFFIWALYAFLQSPPEKGLFMLIMACQIIRQLSILIFAASSTLTALKRRSQENTQLFKEGKSAVTPITRGCRILTLLSTLSILIHHFFLS